MKTRALLLAVALASATTAAAQQGPSRNYLEFKLGAIVPQHQDLDGFDTGPAFEVAVGHRLTPNLAIQGGIGRYALSGSFVAFDPTIGQDAAISEDITVVPVSFSLKPTLQSGGLELYGLVGLSMNFVSVSGTNSSPGFQDLHFSDSDTSFGLHFGAGLSGQVAPNFLLGAEARYVVGTARVFDATNHFDSLVIAATGAFRF